MQDLAQQPGQQRDKGHADQGNAAARDQLLDALALCLCEINQLMAGGGIIVLGTTLIPLLSTLF